MNMLLDVKKRLIYEIKNSTTSAAHWIIYIGKHSY